MILFFMAYGIWYSSVLNHISEDHTLLKKSSHTHALITGLFFICLHIFDELSDCFLKFRYMCVLISC
jgi:hypothetical protein